MAVKGLLFLLDFLRNVLYLCMEILIDFHTAANSDPKLAPVTYLRDLNLNRSQ